MFQTQLKVDPLHVLRHKANLSEKMTDSQPENYRKCTPNSCGFCIQGKAPKTIQCSYALTKLNPTSSDEIFPENQVCNYKIPDIHTLAQRSPSRVEPEYCGCKPHGNRVVSSPVDTVDSCQDCGRIINDFAQSSAKSTPRKRMAVSLTEQVENLVEDFKKRKTEHIDPRFPGVTVFYD